MGSGGGRPFTLSLRICIRAGVQRFPSERTTSNHSGPVLSPRAPPPRPALSLPHVMRPCPAECRDDSSNPMLISGTCLHPAGAAPVWASLAPGGPARGETGSPPPSLLARQSRPHVISGLVCAAG